MEFGDVGSTVFGFGETQDGDVPFVCYKYAKGDGTITLNTPTTSGPGGRTPGHVQPTTVTIKATITYYCQCETESYLSPGAGAFWPSTGWGKFCAGDTSKFMWQRNETLYDCDPTASAGGHYGVGTNMCSRREIVEINETETLADFITMVYENFSTGMTVIIDDEICTVFINPKGNELAMIEALKKCGATVSEKPMPLASGNDNVIVTVCYGKKEYDCLVADAFSCNPGNKAAVMGFITKYIDAWFKASGFGCIELI